MFSHSIHADHHFFGTTPITIHLDLRHVHFRRRLHLRSIHVDLRHLHIAAATSPLQPRLHYLHHLATAICIIRRLQPASFGDCTTCIFRLHSIALPATVCTSSATTDCTTTVYRLQLPTALPATVCNSICTPSPVCRKEAAVIGDEGC